MVHAVQMGKRTRMSFSKIEEVLEMPNLIEVQKEGLAQMPRLIRSLASLAYSSVTSMPVAE